MTEVQHIRVENPESSNLSDAATGLVNSSYNGFVFDLPNEIQRVIFEYAAALDGKCAFRLCQVAKYVYTWIHPILYHRVVIQDPQSAVAFFRTLRSRPRGYFEPHIRSLTFSSTVTLPQAKALLVECSRRILVLTLFRNACSEDKILDYVKTPYLRRLTMVCHRDWHPDAQPTGAPNAQYYIPLGILSSLTHLAIVVDYEHGFWGHLAEASLASLYPDNMAYVTSYSAFQNLTHVATSVKALDQNLKIRKVANKLKYFAILEPRNYTDSAHEQLVRRIRLVERDPTSLAGPRNMVILRDLGDPEAWKVEDSFRPLELWKKVEKLVDEGYISDRGERWSRYHQPEAAAHAFFVATAGREYSSDAT